jgi:hypothetical protein
MCCCKTLVASLYLIISSIFLPGAGAATGAAAATGAGAAAAGASPKDGTKALAPKLGFHSEAEGFKFSLEKELVASWLIFFLYLIDDLKKRESKKVNQRKNIFFCKAFCLSSLKRHKSRDTYNIKLTFEKDAKGFHQIL